MACVSARQERKIREKNIPLKGRKEIYEKAGLVTASGRNKYGHLLYDKDAEMRIAQIK